MLDDEIDDVDQFEVVIVSRVEEGSIEVDYEGVHPDVAISMLLQALLALSMPHHMSD